MTPHRPTWRQRFVARLVWAGIRGCAATLRFRVREEGGGLTTAWREPVIFVVWHNRLALSLIVHRRVVVGGAPGRRMAAMVSASRDGALLAAILEAFRVQPVRGSSSRRGAQALLELTSWAERGFDLAITPDGPRGPRYQVQPGVIALASVTGRAIVPVTWNAPWRVELRSWDRFQVPLPFSVCEVVFGPPVRVAAGDAPGLETARVELQRRLEALTKD